MNQKAFVHHDAWNLFKYNLASVGEAEQPYVGVHGGHVRFITSQLFSQLFICV